MNNKLLKGTIVLTITGIITKLIGFYYRIFLSSTIGATGVGIYQMTLPILGLFAALSTAGLELSVSKCVAEEKSPSNAKGKLLSGIMYGQIMSLLSCIVFALLIPIICRYFIKGVSIDILLYILIPSIPLMSLHSALNGYFLGKGKPHISGISICVENFSKLLFTVIFSIYLASGNGITTFHCIIALVISEISSVIFMLIFILKDKILKTKSKHLSLKQNIRIYYHLTMPLSFTRILLSLMHSIEAIIIPTFLMKYGFNNDTAIGTYGILVGMSIPFILFPTAISNSLSNVLLPTLSKDIKSGNNERLSHQASLAIKYSMAMGIFFTMFFIILGKPLGTSFFHTPLAGDYIQILAWLCPFIYIDITLSTIINSFGLTKITCRNNLISVATRTIFILMLVSSKGIWGYLIGLLIGEITSTVLNLIKVNKLCKINYTVTDYLFKPFLNTLIAMGIGLLAWEMISDYTQCPKNIVLLLISGISVVTFFLLNYKLEKNV